jgi:two-component system, NarL family, response regulator LiaR
MIRVMLVDDHEIVLRGLGVFLKTQDDMELVAEAGDGESALEKVGEAQPDVILMDLIMPGIGGVEAIRRIHQAYPDVRIIALTSSVESESVTAALQAGATSYLQKNISSDHLTLAIRAAARGQRSLSPEATQVLIDSMSARPTPPPNHRLNERELEILRLMIKGLNNNEIAERLFVSRSTVKYYITNIFSKLGVGNRSEAISLALRQHIITSE